MEFVLLEKLSDCGYVNCCNCYVLISVDFVDGYSFFFECFEWDEILYVYIGFISNAIYGGSFLVGMFLYQIFHPLHTLFLESIGTPTLVLICSIVINYFFLFICFLLLNLIFFWRVISSCIFLLFCQDVSIFWYKDFICRTLYVIIVFMVLEAFDMSFYYVMHTAPTSFGLAHHFVVKNSHVFFLFVLMLGATHSALSF